MFDSFERTRNKLWFGTIEKMQWFQTPLAGANTSATGWGSEGVTLNGDGYAFNSWGSHKVFQYEWAGGSSRHVANIMKSYADGSYGRGPLYFIDPLSYETNVLPAKLADPSMACNYENAGLVYNVDPTASPTPANSLGLPVTSATYNLNTVTPGFRGTDDAIFIPVPEGYALMFGSFYTYTGTGGVFVSEQAISGGIGAPKRLTALGTSATEMLADTFSGVVGVWVWVGRTSSVNSSVTMNGNIARLIPVDQSAEHVVAENRFTNPNLVGDGTFAEVGRNLFTNPRLVGDGTWAEVRRNYVRQPNFIDNSAWGAASATKQLMTDSTGTFLRVARVGTTGDPNVSISLPLPPSGARNIRLMVRGNGVTKSQGSTLLQEAGPTYNGLSATALPSGTVVPAEWTEYVGADAGLASTVTNARILLRPGQGDGEYLDYKFVYVGGAGGYFDGSTMDDTMPQPEDFRVRWLGTANASESVMEGERLGIGDAGTGCVTIRSTKNGKPALRQYITGLTGNPASIISIPTSIRSGGTAIATKHQDVVFTETSNSYNIAAVLPQQNVPRTNVVGATPNRLVYSALTSSYGLFLQSGAGPSHAGESVWWTDIALFAGDYRYPWNGSTDLTGITQPEDFRTRWTGAVDNSELVLEIEQVRGLTGTECIVGVSNKSGKSAARLIPTSTLSLSRVEILAPTATRSSGTMIATSHIDVPITGTTDRRRGGLDWYGPQTDGPKPGASTGTFALRMFFGPFTGSYFVRFWHGGTQGSGDVWWTDIGLFAGSYDGPWFSGSTLPGGDYRYRWTGAADNSTSEKIYSSAAAQQLRKGPWMGGEGHVGARFVGKPTRVENGPNHIGFAATFKEVIN